VSARKRERDGETERERQREGWRVGESSKGGKEGLSLSCVERA
jgi:hypothetical protein